MFSQQTRVKINQEGQPCRHCRTPVAIRTHEKMPSYKKGGYYFLWWFKCPTCHAIYHVEEAKRHFDIIEPDNFHDLEQQDV